MISIFLIALGKFPDHFGECKYLFCLDTPLLAAGSSIYDVNILNFKIIVLKNQLTKLGSSGNSMLFCKSLNFKYEQFLVFKNIQFKDYQYFKNRL